MSNKLFVFGNNAGFDLFECKERISVSHPVSDQSGHQHWTRQVKIKRVKVTIRMRNPKDNFSVYFGSEEEKETFCNHIQAIMDYLREHSYGEFQLKNFIRYTMNISSISNILNDYNLSKWFI